MNIVQEQHNKMKTKSLLTKVALPLAIAMGVGGCGGNVDERKVGDYDSSYLENQIRQKVTYNSSNNLRTYDQFTNFAEIDGKHSEEFGDKLVWIDVSEGSRDEQFPYMDENNQLVWRDYKEVVSNSDGHPTIMVTMSKKMAEDVLAKLRISYGPKFEGLSPEDFTSGRTAPGGY